MSQKILFATWRTGGLGCVGAVAVERVDGWKAYIGAVDGYNEPLDALNIAAQGAPLMEGEARGFFPQLADREYAL